MDLVAFAILAFALLVYALFSRSIGTTWLSPPLAFAAFGLVVGPAALGIVPFGLDAEAVRVIAEVTLVLVLFTDAARMDLRQLRRDHELPIRLLLVALPLTIIAGTVVAWLLFPTAGLATAALIAAVLAPTDAALGQAVVTDNRVPVRVRQALNVESGLNDGIVLPVVLILAALAGAGAGHHGGGEGGAGFWARFVGLQLILGPAVGIAVGVVGGRLIDWAATGKHMSEAFQGLSALGLAALSFAAAELVGGNGFIAAFAGGLAFGATIRHACDELFNFAEAEGQLLVLITFAIFGATMLPVAIANTTPAILLYAVLSLTAVRMLPTALSLVGSGVQPATVMFLGWFGPRGLASVLFALVVVEEAGLAAAGPFQAVVFWTVALSIVAHGVSAAPAAARYGGMTSTLRDQQPDCAEAKTVEELPTRVFAARQIGA